MELTPEEKQRILEEEQQRFAEEQYREEVRKRLRPGAQAAKSAARKKGRWGWVFLGLLLVALGATPMLMKIFRPDAQKRTSSTDTKGSPEQKQLSFEEQKKAMLDKAYGRTSDKVLTTQQIADKCSPSVVVVQRIGENGQLEGEGSGYVYSSDGIVITNYHVIREAFNIRVKPFRASWVDAITVLGYDLSLVLSSFRLSTRLRGGLEGGSRSMRLKPY